MTIRTIPQATEQLVALYRTRRERLFTAESADQRARRDGAIEAFAALGVPSHRDEAWKYTSLARLAQTVFTLDESPAAVGRDQIEPFLLHGSGPTLVFVNGFFVEDLSRLARLPGGATVGAMRSADPGGGDAAHGLLERCAELAPAPFALLNRAMSADGALIRIPKDTQCVDPIQVLFIATGGAAPVASFPRLVIVADEGAQASVVENHVALGDRDSLTIAATEIEVGANAHVDHARSVESGPSASHLGSIAIRQGRDSRAESVAVAIGGAVTRHDFRVSLDGAGADCNLRGLAMLAGAEHVDNHLLVRHSAPNCTSREFFKNVLDGSSRGVFCGRIYVDQDAQKTDGVQTNANLLLSDDARAETRPQLEIYADDVTCTHGATVGQLDDEAIFYLRARGVPEAPARGMLIRGFAGEILDEIRIEALRDRLRARLFSSHARGGALHATAG